MGNAPAFHQWNTDRLEILAKIQTKPPESERMRKNIILSLAVAALALVVGNFAQAQSYSNAVVGLNPVAYWPLTETTQPPSGAYIATNLGTAGANANGFYETWFQPFATGTNTLYYQTNN